MAVPVIMPKLEMVQETATVIEWLKQEGEHVEKGEPLLVIETSKVTIEVESPASGILAGVRVGPGQVVPVTEVIAYVLQPGEELPEEVPPEATAILPPSAAPAAPPAPTPPAVSSGPPAPSVAATPVARRMAEAHGLDLSTIVGTGPRGEITRADVEAVLSAPSQPTAASRSEKVRATPAARRIARERKVDLSAVTGSGPRGRIQAADVLGAIPTPEAAPAPVATVVPLTGMRRTIAERMTTSYQTAPHITFTVRVDMSGFQEARKRLNARAEATGEARISATALIVKAVAWALKHHPWLNSTLRDEEIHLLPEINVGVAVALKDGLIVPVVHQADRKGVAKIAAEVRDLVVRAREGRLTPADITGGTFTVSNLGPFGIEQFTAIINPPQVAILAVGATQPEPVADEGGQIVVRPMMRMTLSVDHRVVDGATAARFLTDLRDVLEAPALLSW
ncbi:MAG: 2-oxo acid dehydrogenase subunit E2 [Anaerolineae bacterium]|nr:2-oxo acid dehydrogenase subunit E2 [Anaerolineae bacterium]